MHTCTDTTSADAVIACYDTHTEVRACVKALSLAGFDIARLSIVGKGFHNEEQAMGFCTNGDQLRSWGTASGFWGAVWGVRIGPAVFMVPGLGLVAAAGPFVPCLAGALAHAPGPGGPSALGRTLMSLGLGEDLALRREADVLAERFLLIVQGSRGDRALARSILEGPPTPTPEQPWTITR